MKRKVISLILIQILILIGFGVWQWNQELHEYTIDGNALTSEIGVKTENGYQVEEFDPVVLEKKSEGELLFFTKGIVPFIGRGSYEVTVQYHTDVEGNRIEVQSWENSPSLLITDPLILAPQLNEMKTIIWIDGGIKNLEVKSFYKGEGSFEIGTIHLMQTKDKIGHDLFRMFALFLIIDVLIWGRWYWKKYPSSTEEGRQKRWIVLILAGIMIILSLPLAKDSLIHMNMEDLDYHLGRIVGMKSAIRDGQFPIRIHSALNWGFGYASSMFYPELFLYPSAILHTIGVPLMQSYKVFVLLMNGMTVLISYWCIKRMFQSRMIGLLGTMAYSLAYYRLINVYLRAAVGEAMAMTFLPLIVYGIYRIYTMDTREKAYRFVWIIPTIGYAGLIQSHMISCEMVAVITLIVCMLLLRSTLEKHRFWALCKTASMAIILNLWFLVPMVDGMISGPVLCFMGEDINWIQSKGLRLSQVFHLFFEETSNNSGHYIGLGPIFSILFFAFLAAILIWNKKEKSSSYYRLGKWFFGLGSLTLFLGMMIFPWDFIREMGIIGSVLTKFRLPSRYLSIATVFFTFLGCCFIVLIMRKYPTRKKQIWILSAAMIGFFAVQQLDVLQSSAPLIQTFSGANQITTDRKNIGWGAEYVPFDVNEVESIDPNRDWTEQTGVVSYQKSGTKVIVNTANATAENLTIQVPLIYYKGYYAETIEGQKLDVHGGDGGMVMIEVPAGYTGTIGVWYKGFWYWDFAIGISVGAVLFVIWMGKKSLKYGF